MLSYLVILFPLDCDECNGEYYEEVDGCCWRFWRQVAIWSSFDPYFHIMHVFYILNTMHVLLEFSQSILLDKAIGYMLYLYA